MHIVSEKEKFKLEVLQELLAGQIERGQAATLMGITLRQLDRIRAKYKKEGLTALIHGNRGRKSNRAMPESLQEEIVDIVRSYYPDFGPTLASEKLLEHHGHEVSVEKLRRMMISEGLWKGKKRKQKRAYQRRTRRSRRGDLLQGDASPHDWFEGRGPRCNLVSFIDDATGHITARFEPGETYEGYSRLFKGYIETHGRPQALYVDKSSIFRVNNGKHAGSANTSFGVVLKTLKIDLIWAHSPQAKGRVERMYKTFQDRVIKEMRLANVCTIEEANEFLTSYLPVYNKRFSKDPASEEDAHNPIPDHINLYETFTRRETRKLSSSLDFSFENTLYQVIDCPEPRRMMNQSITVFVALDGEKWAEYRGKRLKIKIFNETTPEPGTMDRKQLDAWLDRKAPMTVKERVKRKIAIPR